MKSLHILTPADVGDQRDLRGTIALDVLNPFGIATQHRLPVGRPV